MAKQAAIELEGAVAQVLPDQRDRVEPQNKHEVLTTLRGKMRVLHVYAGNLYGGVETLLLTLARHRDLCPEMEPHFALCFESRLSRELVSTGTPVHQLGHVRLSRPASVWRVRRAMRDLLRTGGFDVVICHSVWPQVIFGPVVRSAGLPLLFWLHDAANGTHWLERWARLTRPDLSIYCSRFTGSTLPKLYPKGSAELLACPVTPLSSGFSPAERHTVRSALDTSDSATVIVQVSRMEPYKGHRLHLEALALLRDVPGWVCWQIGGAQRPHELRYLEELKQTAERLGITERVRFLGQRTDVQWLLPAADIHCQPNIGAEPFGITFIEALYAGLPVVTAAIGGGKEIVDDTCGILVSPNDKNALAAALRGLIEDEALRRRLSATSPARARALCDPATQLTRLAELCEGVLRRSPTGRTWEYADAESDAQR